MVAQKLRPPGSIEDAMVQALAILGDAGVEKATGKSAGLARKWSDPDADDHHIQLRQAAALDAACLFAGQDGPFGKAFPGAVAARLEALGGPAAGAAAKDPLARIASVTADLGDVAREVAKAAADGRFDAAECKRIFDELHEMIREAEKLFADVEARR